MIKNITIGSDPEFLIYNKKTKLCYPSTEFTIGTKEYPEDIGSGFYIQRDNALLEGNIPPVTEKEHFIFNMNFLISYLKDVVGFNKDLEIIFKDSGDYNEDDLEEPDMKIFGCDPFNNAWTGEETSAPDLSMFNHRTVGFHIHVGYTLDTDKFSKDDMDKYIVKAFDRMVILPSYLLHFDPRRSTAYGGLGQYREKSYGVECRSLGGHFCAPSRLEWVWDRTMEALDFCKEESNLKILDDMKIPSVLSPEKVNEYLKEITIEIPK